MHFMAASGLTRPVMASEKTALWGWSQLQAYSPITLSSAVQKSKRCHAALREPGKPVLPSSALPGARGKENVIRSWHA